MGQSNPETLPSLLKIGAVTMQGSQGFKWPHQVARMRAPSLWYLLYLARNTAASWCSSGDLYWPRFCWGSLQSIWGALGSVVRPALMAQLWPFPSCKMPLGIQTSVSPERDFIMHAEGLAGSEVAADIFQGQPVSCCAPARHTARGPLGHSESSGPSPWCMPLWIFG